MGYEWGNRTNDIVIKLWVQPDFACFCVFSYCFAWFAWFAWYLQVRLTYFPLFRGTLSLVVHGAVTKVAVANQPLQPLRAQSLVILVHRGCDPCSSCVDPWLSSTVYQPSSLRKPSQEPSSQRSVGLASWKVYSEKNVTEYRCYRRQAVGMSGW